MSREDEMVRKLLRRVALGLPVVFGPLVVGLSASGCTHCYANPVASSSHPRSALTERFVGTPERFDPSQCDTLCRMLDDVDNTRDASLADGGSGDAGMRLYVPYGTRGPAVASCNYEDDSLYCLYVDRFCETSASCSPAVYGRTPTGLLVRRSLATSPLARWLADAAHLEAASVPAFDELAAELRSFGAPELFVRAATRSAHDERRHARMMGRLAQRLGAEVAPVRRSETELRGPDEVAHDNAVEGCVREAYGALAAAHQATNATSLAVRRAYRSIAQDEARHALLSFAANDWLTPRLSTAARRRTEEARRETLAEFGRSLEHEPEAALHTLGLPDATRSMDLLSLLG